MNLKILNVEHNNLESLPDSISLLKNLKVLNVSSNKLTVLPESILHCRYTSFLPYHSTLYVMLAYTGRKNSHLGSNRMFFHKLIL